MTFSTQETIAEIRKVNFEKESKNSATITNSSLEKFHSVVQEQIKSLQSTKTSDEAKEIMIQTLNTRIFEIIKMRNEKELFSKRDQGKNYLNNIAETMRNKIVEIYSEELTL